jgi:putative ABC transport system substrate-binding protein
MKRRRAMALVGGAVLTPGCAWAQTQARAYRVGGLTPVPRSAAHWVALFEELRGAGFVEGMNLAVAGFGVTPDQLEATAADLVRSNVDAILTGGTGPTRMAQRATATIPILTAVDDFVAQGFVASLARPAGNITGVSILGPELDGKRQEFLLTLVPNLRQIAALADPGSTSPQQIEALQAAAQVRGVSVSVHRAASQAEIAPAIEAARAAGVQAVNVLASQLFNVNRAEIMARIAQAALPAIYQWPEWVVEGGLAAYGPRFPTVYRQVARQLVRVLRGARPADIPVEQPTRVELALNRPAASRLGLTIPASLLVLADEVIE